MPKRIDRVLPLAQLLLDRDLEVLASYGKRDQELLKSLRDLDRKSSVAWRETDFSAAARMAIWQDWQQTEKKRLLAERAAVKARMEEARVEAQHSFGQLEALKKIRQKLSG